MRERFIKLVEDGGLPFAHVCARFGISRKTGYKWLNRFRAEGPAGLLERDRAPRSHPRRTAPEIEALVAELGAEQPEWTSGRLREALAERGVEPLPALTTIDAIRRRADGDDPARRGDRPAPNDVWQLHVGPVTVSAGLNHRAYVLRDRATGFVLAAEIVPERGEQGCRDVLWAAFGRHGLPRRLAWPTDGAVGEADAGKAIRHTPLSVAVMKRGVAVEWSEVGPGDAAATDGEAWRALSDRLKRLPAGSDVGRLLQRRLADETAEAMPLARPPNEALTRWRGRLTAWADRTNLPVGQGTPGGAPVNLYRPSPRKLDAVARPAETVDDSDEMVRRVSEKGIFHFDGRRWLLGRAFAGETVALRRLDERARLSVYFAGQPVGLVDVLAEEPSRPKSQPVVSIDRIT